jgi:glycosyltransferase involved in cell wall biosynthesis
MEIGKMSVLIPFDQYQRYKNAAEVIHLWMKSTDTNHITVLEVGANEHKNIEYFFGEEEAKITYLDLEVPESLRDDPSYVVGDATAMNFEDESFDWVIALDVFEHILPERRKLFIDELNRVSKYGVLFCAPFYSVEVEKAEKRVNSLYKGLYGEDYIWLKEHRERGLPRLDETIQYLQQREIPHVIFGHGALNVWELMTSAHFIAAAYNDVIEYRWHLDEFYNNNIYFADYTDKVYRHFIISIKHSDCLSKVSEWVSERRAQKIHEEHLRVLNRGHNMLTLLHISSSSKVFNPNELNVSLRELVFNVLFTQHNSVFHEIAAKNALVESELDKLLNVFVTERELQHGTLRQDLEHRKNIETKLENIIKKLEQEIDNKKQHVDWLSKEIDSSRKKEQELINTIRDLESEAEDKKRLITRLEQEIEKITQEYEKSRNEFQESLMNKNQQIANLMQEVSQKSAELTNQNTLILSLTNQNKQIESKCTELIAAMAEKDLHIMKLQNLAESMRLKNRAKKMIPSFLKKPVKNALLIYRLVKKNPRYFVRGLNEFRRSGISGLKERIVAVKLKEEANNSYNNHNDRAEDIELLALVEGFAYKPLISVLMPVYNVDPKWLDLAVKSVQQQLYPNWELCIVDDCSSHKATVEYLRQLNDPRIKIKYLKENKKIAASSNEAASMANGEYIALLDHDDELTPDALLEVVNHLQETKYDLLYTDEDKVDVDGNRKNPLYKPDWSPDLLRSQMYFGHLLVIKKSMFDKVGGFRVGFEGAQDYDLVLRITEDPGCKIKHISKVLYSWREIPSSTALNPYAKPYAHVAGLNAVGEHLVRMYGQGKAWVEETDYLFVYNARYRLEENLKVSIIIPTKDKVELLEPCIESIVDMTDYPDYEILIMNNNSEEETTFKWFEEALRKYSNKIKIINANYPFNWSKLNNHGIREASGDVFVFLNNDTQVLTSDWLTRLAEKAVRPDVGTVGALLLFEDGTIQHAGVVIGMGGWADHVFKGLTPVHYGSPFISPMVVRNVSSNTGACLAISRKTIEKIGDFDEEFIVCGSDVEISIRAMKHGLFNIYDPNVRLVHYESKTRSTTVPEKDFEMSALHYEYYWKNGDPYYNRNLSLQHLVPTVK